MAGNGKKKLPRGIDRARNGDYRARIMVDGYQHTLGSFQTIGDARAALDIARSEKARGIFVPPAVKRAERKAAAKARAAQAAADARTIRQMFQAWTAWHVQRELKLSTRYTYARHLEAHFLPEFGDRAVASVTPEDLSDWLDRLEQKRGVAGASPIHQAVAAMFKWGTGDAPELPRDFTPWLIASPVPPLAARRARNKRAHPDRNRTLATAEDIATMADNMPARERLAVLLAGWCGLRLGEVLGLRRKDVTQDHTGLWWVEVRAQVQARGSGPREETPKSAAGHRRIPVTPVIAEDVRAHLDEHTAKGQDSLLFPRHPEGNEVHNPNTVRKHFNIAREAMNADRTAHNATAPEAEQKPLLENFTFHGLRHTALTRLGQAGATTAELKAYAGHSDGASVERYQHAERERLASLAGMLDQPK